MKKLLVAVAAVAAFGAFGETYYVDGSVEVSGDGSKDSPVKTVAEGVALAVNDGDVVEIAKGTYPITTPIQIARPITVRGATGNPEDVVIDAQKKCTAVYVTSAAGTAKIFHLTMKRGVGVNGGGTAANNRAGNISLYSAATVSNCFITAGSYASNSGAGGVLISANALVTHCKIWGNDISGGSGSGGGVSMSTGTLSDCLILSNKVKKASSGLGGGVFLANGGVVRNCTIAYNSANKGGGVYFSQGAGPKFCVYNSIIQNNSVGGEGRNILGKYGVSASFMYNCASSDASATATFGSNYVNLGESIPFDEAYRLTKSGYDLVGGKGDPTKVIGTADFFGTPRPMEGGVVTSTDIGCAQYVPSEVKSVRFEASPLKGVGPTEVTFVATPDGGLDLETADCTWYLNGVPVEGEKGATMVKTLEPGFYSAKFTATDADGTYTWEEPAAKYISIMPTDVFVAPGGDGEVPYDAPEKATSNLLTVANTYLQSGVTLHIAAGLYPLKSSLSVTDGVKVYGAGRDKTVLYATGNEYSVVEMTGTGAYMEGVCVSNSSGATGLCIYGRGGHFTQGRIVKCTGRVNQAGGGAQLSCSDAILSHSVIANNETRYTNTNLHPGGGVSVEAGRMNDCLVIGNKGAYAGGVLVSGGTLANCTVVGNTTHMEVGANVPGGGGICRTGGSVYNCIAYGNKEYGSEASENQIKGSVTACWTEDPKFLDAANGDYRISAWGPCAYSGKYQSSWMEGATDFFGNPRATPGKKVSIGYCQAPDPGLMLLVR